MNRPRIGPWARLKDARLVRVLGIYAAVAWVVLQAIGLFIGTMGLPSWTMPVALVLLAVGLVIVLATAWVQSQPQMERRAAAAAVPDDWELDVRDLRASVRAGRLPHLNWARAVAGGVIALSLLIGVAAVYQIRSGAGAAGDVSDWVIATMPFTVRGSDEVAYLGEGIVNLLGTKLDGAGELRSVDARALLASIGRDGSGDLDPRSAADVARSFGAGIYVLGEVVEAGSRLRIDAALYRTEGATLVAETSAEGSPEELFGMVDEIAARILANLDGDPGARVARIAAVTTSSLPALKSYLTGERAFRAGEYVAALESFQAAVAQDSLFALAHYRMTTAAEYAGRPDLVMEAAEKARRYSDRLSERDRTLLEASAAFRRGDVDEAEGIYRSLLGRYPDDVQAWFDLGDLVFHLNPLQGRPGVEARAPFNRVLQFEPDHATTMLHLIRLEAADGKLAAMDSLVQRYIAIAGSGERALEVLAVQAFAHNDEAAAGRVLAQLETAPDGTLLSAARSVTLFGGDLAEAERVVRLMVVPGRSPEIRATGHLLLAHLHLAAGRWTAARPEFDRARAIAPTALSAYYEVVAASLPFVPSTDEQIDELIGYAATLPAEPTGATVDPLLHRGAEAHVRAFVQGLAGARRGRPAVARAAAAELVRLGGLPEAPTMGADLARTIAGYAAWRGGSPAEALPHLGALEMRGGYILSAFSALYSHAFARYVQAAALEDAGRGGEADRWYATLTWTSPYEIIYRAPAELARGRIREASGDAPGAIAHYERFVELWSEADPALRPMVEEARRAIKRLRSR